MGQDFAGYTYEDILWAVNAIEEARYAIAAVYGLQIFEWLAGLDKEIRLVYSAKWNSVKVAYLLCRYYPLFLWPAIMWAYIWDHSHATCTRIGTPLHILLVPCQFFPQAVMMMRAYAFSGRDRHVLLALGLAYVGLLTADIWAFCTHVDMPPPAFYILFRNKAGCFPNYGSGIMGMRIGVSMLAAILMDLISLVTVLIYCKKENDLRGGSLAQYFMRQGLGAFVIVTVVNVGAAIAFFKPPMYHSGVGLPLILVVPNLVACRVILQLRRKVYPTKSEIARLHSLLVDIALAPSKLCDDIWLMDCEPDSDSASDSLPR